MDSSSIQLDGSEIESVEQQDDTVRIHFSKAIIIKTMTGSVEKTKWWQSGYLVFEGIEDAELVSGPQVCAGGDIGENVYTYRDMIPVPLDSRGRAHCDLYFRENTQHLRIQAAAVHLEMLDVPRYIEHIRPAS